MASRSTCAGRSPDTWPRSLHGAPSPAEVCVRLALPLYEMGMFLSLGHWALVAGGWSAEATGQPSQGMETLEPLAGGLRCRKSCTSAQPAAPASTQPSASPSDRELEGVGCGAPPAGWLPCSLGWLGQLPGARCHVTSRAETTVGMARSAQAAGIGTSPHGGRGAEGLPTEEGGLPSPTEQTAHLPPAFPLGLGGPCKPRVTLKLPPPTSSLLCPQGELWAPHHLQRRENDLMAYQPGPK